MEEIRVNKDNVYKIVVNDNGEVIEIDLLDLEFPIKCIEASKTLEKETKLYNEKVEELHNLYKDNPIDFLYNRNELDRKYCKEMREMIDNLCGENASQKIFGSKNRLGMFDEFFEKLIPILDKMQYDAEEIKENLIKRYKESSN